MEWLAPGVKPAARQARPSRGSFAEHDLDAEPNRPDEPCDDNCNDGLDSIALHAAKDDQPVAGRFDLVMVYPEPVTQPESSDLALDQALGRLRQRPLCFADTHRQRAALGL